MVSKAGVAGPAGVSLAARVIEGGEQNHCGQEEAIDAEGDEGVALEEAQEEPDGEIAGDRCGEEAEGGGQQGEGPGGLMDPLGDVVQAGAGDDGGGHQKGEASGGAAVEAQKEAGGHGDAAAGDPGHDGKGLGEADEDGVL
jgi:hypothetical protein